MNKVKKYISFKVISAFVAISFVTLEMAWAYPAIGEEGHTLAVQSMFQPKMMTENADNLQKGMVSDSQQMASVLSIGKYLLGDPERSVNPLPLEHLESVMRTELGGALAGINVSHVAVENGMILIPCEAEGKKSIFQIALKKDILPEDKNKFNWDISGKYAVRIVPEKYEAPAEKLDTEKNVQKKEGSLFTGFDEKEALAENKRAGKTEDIDGSDIHDFSHSAWKEAAFWAAGVALFFHTAAILSGYIMHSMSMSLTPLENKIMTTVLIGAISIGTYFFAAAVRYLFVGRAVARVIKKDEPYLSGKSGDPEVIAKSNGYRNPAFYDLPPRVQRLVTIHEGFKSHYWGFVGMLPGMGIFVKKRYRMAEKRAEDYRKAEDANIREQEQADSIFIRGGFEPAEGFIFTVAGRMLMNSVLKNGSDEEISRVRSMAADSLYYESDPFLGASKVKVPKFFAEQLSSLISEDGDLEIIRQIIFLHAPSEKISYKGQGSIKLADKDVSVRSSRGREFFRVDSEIKDVISKMRFNGYDFEELKKLTANREILKNVLKKLKNQKIREEVEKLVKFKTRNNGLESRADKINALSGKDMQKLIDRLAGFTVTFEDLNTADRILHEVLSVTEEKNEEDDIVFTVICDFDLLDKHIAGSELVKKAGKGMFKGYIKTLLVGSMVLMLNIGVAMESMANSFESGIDGTGSFIIAEEAQNTYAFYASGRLKSQKIPDGTVYMYSDESIYSSGIVNPSTGRVAQRGFMIKKTNSDKSYVEYSDFYDITPRKPETEQPRWVKTYNSSGVLQKIYEYDIEGDLISEYSGGIWYQWAELFLSFSGDISLEDGTYRIKMQKDKKGNIEAIYICDIDYTTVGGISAGLKTMTVYSREMEIDIPEIGLKGQYLVEEKYGIKVTQDVAAGTYNISGEISDMFIYDKTGVLIFEYSSGVWYQWVELSLSFSGDISLSSGEYMLKMRKDKEGNTDAIFVCDLEYKTIGEISSDLKTMEIFIGDDVELDIPELEIKGLYELNGVYDVAIKYDSVTDEYLINGVVTYMYAYDQQGVLTLEADFESGALTAIYKWNDYPDPPEGIYDRFKQEFSADLQLVSTVWFYDEDFYDNSGSIRVKEGSGRLYRKKIEKSDTEFTYLKYFKGTDLQAEVQESGRYPGTLYYYYHKYDINAADDNENELGYRKVDGYGATVDLLKQEDEYKVLHKIAPGDGEYWYQWEKDASAIWPDLPGWKPLSKKDAGGSWYGYPFYPVPGADNDLTDPLVKWDRGVNTYPLSEEQQSEHELPVWPPSAVEDPVDSQDGGYPSAVDFGGHEDMPAIKEEQAGEINDIFKAVEAKINNRRSLIITAGNRIINYLELNGYPVPERIEREMSTAELYSVLREIITVIDEKGRDNLPEGIMAEVKDIEDNIDMIEVDSIVASVIVMARRAGRKEQDLIIGLETEWIPDNNKRTMQHAAINPLIRQLESLGDIFKRMGLSNVRIIHAKSADLADDVIDEAEKTSTDLSNVIVLASETTISMPKFDNIRSSKNEKKAFLAGVDPSELKMGSSSDTGVEINVVHIIRMLSIVMELAVGRDIPDIPMIVSYDRDSRTVIFLPKAEPLKYEQLRDFYLFKKEALKSA